MTLPTDAPPAVERHAYFLDWNPVGLAMLAGGIKSCHVAPVNDWHELTVSSGSATLPEAAPGIPSGSRSGTNERLPVAKSILVVRRADGIFLFCIEFHDYIDRNLYIRFSSIASELIKERLFGHFHLYHQPRSSRSNRKSTSTQLGHYAIRIEDIEKSKFYDWLRTNCGESNLPPTIPAADPDYELGRWDKLDGELLQYQASRLRAMRTIARSDIATALVRATNPSGVLRPFPACRVLASKMAEVADRYGGTESDKKMLSELERSSTSEFGRALIAGGLLVAFFIFHSLYLNEYFPGAALIAFVVYFLFIMFPMYATEQIVAKKFRPRAAAILNTTGYMKSIGPFGQIVQLLYAEDTLPKMNKEPYANLAYFPYSGAQDKLRAQLAIIEHAIVEAHQTSMKILTASALLVALLLGTYQFVSKPTTTPAPTASNAHIQPGTITPSTPGNRRNAACIATCERFQD